MPEDNFTTFAVVPKPEVYRAQVDNLSGMLSRNPMTGKYSGNLNLGIPTEQGNINIGTTIMQNLPALYDAAIQRGDFTLATQIGNKFKEITAYYGPAYAGVTKTSYGGTEPFVGYQSGGLDVTATPKSLSANYSEQSPTGKEEFVAAGTLTKQGLNAQAQFRKLYENGYINLQGEITPEGYRAGIGGEFSF